MAIKNVVGKWAELIDKNRKSKPLNSELLEWDLKDLLSSYSMFLWVEKGVVIDIDECLKEYYAKD